MITIGFAGWFQCRLATDPDPFDEPRGVSGYVFAYAGEPDLDRIVHFQKPAFVRSHGPDIGVRVTSVRVDGQPQPAHALLGAPVSLLDDPVFEGRNGVVSEDGFEPVFPFNLQISAKSLSFSRAVAPHNPHYPFDELLAGGVDVAPQEIAEATGVPSLQKTWTVRLAALKSDLAAQTDPVQSVALKERIAFLQNNLASPRGAARFFAARMNYAYLLRSEPVFEGDLQALGQPVSHYKEWPVSFWLGGWDADLLCGYCLGTLTLPRPEEPQLLTAVSYRRMV